MSAIPTPAAVHPLASEEVKGNPLAAAPLISTPPPPPQRTDPIERFLAGPIAPWRRPALDASSTPTCQSLEMLACAGSWKAVASGAQLLLAAGGGVRGGPSSSLPLDVQLRVRFLRIAALVKLRQVPTAEREMSLLGDLAGDAWLYETHAAGSAPGAVAPRRGSMVPFEMLHLHALMPSYSGHHATAIGRLLSLVQALDRSPWPEAAAESAGSAVLDSGIDAAAVGGMAGDAPPQPLSAEATVRLAEQRRAVHLSLVNEYSACADYPLAVAHLERLIEAEPAEIEAPVAGGGAGGGAQAWGVAGGSGGGGSGGALAAAAALAGGGVGGSAGSGSGGSGASGSGGSGGGACGGRTELLSLLGRLLLQSGNMEAAEDAFNRLECLVADSDASVDVRMNRGCLMVAQGEATACARGGGGGGGAEFVREWNLSSVKPRSSSQPPCRL